jgi:hypothetical protein
MNGLKLRTNVLKPFTYVVRYLGDAAACEAPAGRDQMGASAIPAATRAITSARLAVEPNVERDMVL